MKDHRTLAVLTAALAIVLARSSVRELSAQAVARVDLPKLLGVSAARVRATALMTAAGTTKIADTARHVTIARGTFLVAALHDTLRSHTTVGEAHLDLPLQLYGLNAAGVGVRFLVRCEIVGGGLKYDPADGLYRGDLLVGLENAVAPGASDSLSGTVRLQLTGPDTVSPGQLTLSHTNIPYASVRLAAATHSNVVTMHIHPSFEAAGTDVPIPVRQPLFLVAVSPKRIDGYGLGAATLTILGTSRVPEESVGVSVDAERGTLGVTSLQVARNHAATTTVRSRGLGDDRLSVRSGRSDSMVVMITYVAPLAFLVAALLGGLFGASLTRLKARKQQRDASWARYVGAGVISGVVSAVAWALGVNLLGVSIRVPNGSEGAAFVIAYLAGHQGLSTLSSRMAPVAHWLGGPHG